MGNIPIISAKANPELYETHQLSNRRSVFPHEDSILTTIDADVVYPIWWKEVIPSDTIKIDARLGGRLTTPIYPVMDNLRIQYDFWLVYNRLTWHNFIHQMGEKKLEELEDPSRIVNVRRDYLTPIVDEDSKDFLAKTGTIKTEGFGFNGLYNYILAGNEVGTPMDTAKGHYITNLVARSYMLIGYKWYWHQDYGTVFVNPDDTTDEVQALGFLPISYGDGPDNAQNYQLFKKGKKLDYFTSVRPMLLSFSGDPTSVQPTEMIVPLSNMLGQLLSKIPTETNNQLVTYTTNGDPTTQRNLTANSVNSLSLSGAALGSNQSARVGNETGIQVDMTDVGVNIVNIRLYEQLMKYYERLSTQGGRYVEVVFATYGVEPDDTRSQLPEWLGGYDDLISFNPVSQTSESNGTPLGEQGAYATLSTRMPTITKSIKEHGYILCLASIYPDLTYQSGLPIELQRRTKLDYFDPLLENITDRATLCRELKMNTTPPGGVDDYVLGYNSRFLEMKYGRRRISGLFRSTHPQSLDSWHLAQDFQTDILGMGAVLRTYDTDMGRILAVQDQPDLLLYGEITSILARPMQIQNKPTIGGF